MKLTDEMINKYLDNDLSSVEIEGLKKAISDDKENLQNLNLYKFIEQEIAKLKIYSAPANITEIIMNRISEGIAKKYRKNNFFYFIVSFFTVGILGFLGFAIFNQNDLETQNNYFDDAVHYFTNNTPSLQNITLTNETMLIIGAGLTLLFLLSAFFLFDSHKSIKNEIENYGK
jgi:hypothetical protein